MLKDLTIKNYRPFRRFTLDSIARVNLIVGPNNCGKSSLLEAIYLLAGEGLPLHLLNILNNRGEFVSEIFSSRARSSGGYQMEHIFYKHQLKAGHDINIRSSLEKPISLTISCQENQDSNDEIGALVLAIEYIQPDMDPVRQTLHIQEDGLYPSRRRYFSRPSFRKQRNRLITTSYLGYDELAALWDNITLTPREDKVVEALQILDPNVKRLSFTSRQTSNTGVLLKLKGEDKPIPLGSVGDGMRRVLTLAASLVSVEDGTLLVDEIDTGLYYGTLVDVWRLILETSAKQNAQVFVTTHSWDCVKSFQEALSEAPDDDLGLLIRLDSQDDIIQATSYSRDELEIAMRDDIEVR